MRRSSRISSLYGTEWSNLPSVKAQAQQAQHVERAEHVERAKHVEHVERVAHAIHVPTRGVYMVTDEELHRDRSVIQYYLSQYDDDASAIQRVRMITPFFEYLAERPYFLLVNLGMKWTILRKCQEFKPLIDAQMARLAEYRAAAKLMEAVLHGPLMEKGKEILSAGMKAYEEEIWNDLKAATDTLAILMA
jgi:hypothetical protein